MSVLAKLLSRAVAPQRCICIVRRDACDRCWCACTWFHGFPEYVWYRLAILVGECACSHGADFLGAGVGVGRAGLSPVDPDQVVRPALALMHRRRRCGCSCVSCADGSRCRRSKWIWGRRTSCTSALYARTQCGCDGDGVCVGCFGVPTRVISFGAGETWSISCERTRPRALSGWCLEKIALPTSSSSSNR